MASREEIIRTPEQKEAHAAYRASLRREAIREGVITNIAKGCPEMLCGDVVKLSDKILKDEDSQGVVIKVERELPDHGYAFHHLGFGESGMSSHYHYMAEQYIKAQQEMIKVGCGFFETLI